MSSFSSGGRNNGTSNSSSSSSFSSSAVSSSPQVLSKEQLRMARLIALGQEGIPLLSSQSTTTDNYKSTDNTSNHQQISGLPTSSSSTITNRRTKLTSQLFQRLQRIIYKGGGSTIEDMNRWYQEGFVFSNDDQLFYGLKQSNGGPCGILAVVQAEIIKEMLFNRGNSNDSVDSSINQIHDVSYRMPVSSELDMNRVFVRAIINILHRATNDDNHHGTIQLLIPSSYYDAMASMGDTNSIGGHSSSDDSSGHYGHHKYPHDWTANDLVLLSFTSKNEAINYLKENKVLLSMFQSNCGCIVFLMSLVLTRGIDRVADDMDDVNNTCKTRRL